MLNLSAQDLIEGSFGPGFCGHARKLRAQPSCCAGCYQLQLEIQTIKESKFVDVSVLALYHTVTQRPRVSLPMSSHPSHVLEYSEIGAGPLQPGEGYCLAQDPSSCYNMADISRIAESSISFSPLKGTCMAQELGTKTEARGEEGTLHESEVLLDAKRLSQM